MQPINILDALVDETSCCGKLLPRMAGTLEQCPNCKIERPEVRFTGRAGVFILQGNTYSGPFQHLYAAARDLARAAKKDLSRLAREAAIRGERVGKAPGSPARGARKGIGSGDGGSDGKGDGVPVASQWGRQTPKRRPHVDRSPRRARGRR